MDITTTGSDLSCRGAATLLEAKTEGELKKRVDSRNGFLLRIFFLFFMKMMFGHMSRCS